MQKLLKKLKVDFPKLNFISGSRFRWAPASQTITYVNGESDEQAMWALLHELAHAQLGHESYALDVELLLMEVNAWEAAKRLAADYDYRIDDNHIQDCLDTYRDWLDQRSTCPACGNNSLQQSPEEYRCLNCRTTWQVSASRFCRPYRQRTRGKNKTSPALPQTTFQ